MCDMVSQIADNSIDCLTASSVHQLRNIKVRYCETFRGIYELLVDSPHKRLLIKKTYLMKLSCFIIIIGVSLLTLFHLMSITLCGRIVSASVGLSMNPASVFTIYKKPDGLYSQPGGYIHSQVKLPGSPIDILSFK